MVADLVVTGARVRAARGRWADAVAVRGDRIVALGTAAEVAGQIGRGTRVVDGTGSLVLPGFIDAHNHAPQAGRNKLGVWLNDSPGREAYLAEVAAYAASHPGDGWIVGGGWSMEHFPGGNPRREDLDAVVGDRPVFLFNRDVHGAWLSSAALLAAGITRATPDPVDGRIERDPLTGEPTGSLHEGAAYAVADHVVPAPTPAAVEAGIAQAQRLLHAVGVTSWQDAWVTPATQAAYQLMAGDGRLLSRVVGALWWDRHRGLEQIDELVARRAAGGTAAPGVPGFHPTTVKIMTDGVIENGTAALLEPYCLRHGHVAGGEAVDAAAASAAEPGLGLAYLDAGPLAAAVTALDALGFSVHLHTIGDRAVRTALDAIEAAQRTTGRRGASSQVSRPRHHLAHVQLVQRSDIARFAALDVTANCQMFWAKHEPQMDDLTLPVIGADRAGLQYPFESIRAAGGRLAMGSDWPVTTCDPLPQLEVALTRVPHDERGVASFLPAERLGLDDALDAFTVGSAYVNGDDEGGTLQVGSRADLVLLDRDICAPGYVGADRAPIADARVVLTVVAGRVVHDLLP